jgi:hypothetical protein
VKCCAPHWKKGFWWINLYIHKDGKRKKKETWKEKKEVRKRATCINFLYIWFHQHNGIGYFRIFLLFSSISSRLAQRIHHRKCEKVLRMILSKNVFFSWLSPSHSPPSRSYPSSFSQASQASPSHTRHFISRLIFMLMIFCMSFSHEFINNLICISHSNSFVNVTTLPFAINKFSSDEKGLARFFMMGSIWKKRSGVLNWKQWGGSRWMNHNKSVVIIS